MVSCIPASQSVHALAVAAAAMALMVPAAQLVHADSPVVSPKRPGGHEILKKMSAKANIFEQCYRRSTRSKKNIHSENLNN